MMDVLHFSGEESWEDELARNTALFREADLLDEAAYKVIQDGGLEDGELWNRYLKAQALADAKRTAACQDWMRIKRSLTR
ncbi:hypothetical protein E5170_19415 [Pseudomonas atacamensis]|jgi:hypothetical protein|uniref:Uncharacterized protein n=1 Tax=Pseudomonas atacamensis TaxID=2565368 RepID=A0AAQ2HZU4_9PSED|nr:hypothetical protein [Pseudomonas atacamensis]THF29363.1 hypothetical protein E5170_19415 [Pseudomonas atacamensis]